MSFGNCSACADSATVEQGYIVPPCFHIVCRKCFDDEAKEGNTFFDCPYKIGDHGFTCGTKVPLTVSQTSCVYVETSGETAAKANAAAAAAAGAAGAAEPMDVDASEKKRHALKEIDHVVQQVLPRVEQLEKATAQINEAIEQLDRSKATVLAQIDAHFDSLANTAAATSHGNLQAVKDAFKAQYAEQATAGISSAKKALIDQSDTLLVLKSHYTSLIAQSKTADQLPSEVVQSLHRQALLLSQQDVSRKLAATASPGVTFDVYGTDTAEHNTVDPAVHDKVSFGIARVVPQQILVAGAPHLKLTWTSRDYKAVLQKEPRFKVEGVLIPTKAGPSLEAFGYVASIGFNHEGNIIFADRTRNYIHVVGPNGEVVHNVRLKAINVTAYAYNGDIINVGPRNSLIFHNPETGVVHRTVPLGFNVVGKIFANTWRDGSIIVNAQTAVRKYHPNGQLAWVREGFVDAIGSTFLEDPSGQELIAVCDQKAPHIFLLNSQTGETVRTIGEEATEAVKSGQHVVYDPVSGVFVVAEYKGLSAWSLTGEFIHRLNYTDAGYCPSGIAISPSDGSIVVSVLGKLLFY